MVGATREGDASQDGRAIVTRQLRKEFDDLVAVDDLDLTIGKGTLYGMIGPNGSGKTTTIKMLVGLLKPSSGTAEVLGERIPLKGRISDIGYMPQEMAIYTDLTVSENLQLFGSIYSMGQERLLERQEELLSMVDLSDRGDSLASQLSGGMKHRVSLACAMMHDPEVLFLDEPTVGVDPELRMGFWHHFDDLKARGRTVVITTHYMDEAVRCDIVGMMRQGKLIAEGSPRDLMDRSSTSNLEDAFMAFSKGVAE
ncbi:MAG: ABC transporter ATP-binding protein [Candidatus Thermoplasmatota archaeon]|nr:ABC transporter ATP-binding protein [Candidatus Thermoplasmatota archaeon]